MKQTSQQNVTATPNTKPIQIDSTNKPLIFIPTNTTPMLSLIMPFDVVPPPLMAAPWKRTVTLIGFDARLDGETPMLAREVPVNVAGCRFCFGAERALLRLVVAFLAPVGV
jgi:hypothetical protein